MSNDQKRPLLIFVHGSLGTGGAEVLRISVLEELLQRDCMDLRVCVLRERGTLADQVEHLGIPLDVLGNRGGLLDVYGIFRLARYLRRHQPALVQASQFLTNLHTCVANWFTRIPIVVIEEHGIYQWKRWYHRSLDRWINGRSNAVIACSFAVAKSASQHLGLSTDHITVIHNCAAKQHFLQPKSKALVNAKPFIVGIVGTLRQEKGHRYLIEAWQQLSQSHQLPQEAELWIIGDGPLKCAMEELTSGITKVLFLGSMVNTHELYRQFHLFVLPSMSEGFGIAIVEAMCAGVPVIASQSGGIPEVISDGQTGLLVPPGDSTALAESMSYLISHPEKRHSLAASARIDAEARFTPAHYVDELFAMYVAIGLPLRVVEK